MVITGPTKTDVMDMQIISLEKMKASARETFKVYGEVMGD